MSSEKNSSSSKSPKNQANPVGVNVMGLEEPSPSLLSFGAGCLIDEPIVESYVSEVSSTASKKMPYATNEVTSKEVIVDSGLQVAIYKPPISPCDAPLKTVYPVPDSPEPVFTDTVANEEIDKPVNDDMLSDATESEEIPLKRRKMSVKTPVADVPSESEDSDNVSLMSIAMRMMKNVRSKADVVSSGMTKVVSGPSSQKKKISVGKSSTKRTSQRIRSAGLKGKSSLENEVINLDDEDTGSPLKQKELIEGSKKRKFPEKDVDVEDDVENIRSSKKKERKKSVSKYAKKGKAHAVVSDVEPDVQDIRTTDLKIKSTAKDNWGSRTQISKKKKKSSKKGETSVTIFHSMGSQDRWPFVIQRRIPVERPLGPDVKECVEIMELIEKAGLLKTVSGFTMCYAQLVREFISNLTFDVAMPGSDNFHRICVRGKWVLFSPDMINSALDRSDEFHEDIELDLNLITNVITAGKVKVWPAKKLLSSGLLSVKYAILSRIGMLNWIPSNHTSGISVSLARLIFWIGSGTEFDFGSFVFEQTMKHAESYAVKLPISFPSLLSNIMLKQHPDLLLSTDAPLPRGAALTLDHRLFQDPHVLDIALPSSRKSGILSASGNKSTLAELEELSKELEESIRTTTVRKDKVDSLISKLRQGEESVNSSSDESGSSEKNISVKSHSSSDDDAADVEDISDKDSEGRMDGNSA